MTDGIRVVFVLACGLGSGLSIVCFIYTMGRFIEWSNDYISLCEFVIMTLVCSMIFASVLWNAVTCTYHLLKLLKE